MKTIYRMSSDLLRRKNIFDLTRKKLFIFKLLQSVTVSVKYKLAGMGIKLNVKMAWIKKADKLAFVKMINTLSFPRHFSIDHRLCSVVQCEFEFLSILQFELTLIYCRQHFRLPLNVTTILSTSNRKMCTQTVIEK